ncbi:MAG: LacI family DNA-binding transcriptional regulator [Verrucomicrobiota bacterium]
MSPPPPCTLGRLAQSLGVSKSTVHRALAGSSRIAPLTRDRILAAARQAGYQRDPYFASLSALRHHHTVSATLPIHYLQGSPVDPGYKRGIDPFPELQKHGRALGFEFERVNLLDYPRFQTLPRILYQRGCRGLVLEQIDPVMHETLRRFQRVPVVCCERQEGLPFHTVRHESAGRVRLCRDRLRAAGYRRIGCAPVMHDPLHKDDYERLGAALSLVALDARPADRIPPVETPVRRTLNPRAYVAWLERHRPEAVIGNSAGLFWLHQNLSFPPPVFVNLHAAEADAARLLPGATAPPEALVMEILHMLDRLVRHGQTGLPATPIDVVIPPVWHEGAGIPPRP